MSVMDRGQVFAFVRDTNVIDGSVKFDHLTYFSFSEWFSYAIYIYDHYILSMPANIIKKLRVQYSALQVHTQML